MSDAIGLEMRFFLASVLSGIILLIVYDVLRIFRRVVKHARFFVAVEDIIFWLLSGVFIFRMMYKMNNGTIRGFSILGMLLGMIIYNKSLSPFFVRGISEFFLLINKGIAKVFSFLSKPVRIVYRFVKKIARIIKKVITKIGKKMIPILKKPKKDSTMEDSGSDDKLQG